MHAITTVETARPRRRTDSNVLSPTSGTSFVTRVLDTDFSLRKCSSHNEGAVVDTRSLTWNGVITRTINRRLISTIWSKIPCVPTVSILSHGLRWVQFRRSKISRYRRNKDNFECCRHPQHPVIFNLGPLTRLFGSRPVPVSSSRYCPDPKLGVG